MLTSSSQLCKATRLRRDHDVIPDNSPLRGTSHIPRVVRRDESIGKGESISKCGLVALVSQITVYTFQAHLHLFTTQILTRSTFPFLTPWTHSLSPSTSTVDLLKSTSIHVLKFGGGGGGRVAYALTSSFLSTTPYSFSTSITWRPCHFFMICT